MGWSGRCWHPLSSSCPTAKLATAVEGFEPEQQRQQQSYFVRLGSLSTKLRHRALQHSLGKLQSARQSSQDLLAQLQRTLDLVGPIPLPPVPPWGVPWWPPHPAWLCPSPRWRT